MVVAANQIDPKKYARLLARTLPTVIKTEEENERLLAEVEKLIDKGEQKTLEEWALLELMSRLIEDFEENAYPMEDAPPHKVLQHLMEENDLKQADLLPIFGSRGHTSDVVHGKRAMSRKHAKALGEFFHVSPELFIFEADETHPAGSIVHWSERDPTTRSVMVTCAKCGQKRLTQINAVKEPQWTGFCQSCLKKRR